MIDPDYSEGEGPNRSREEIPVLVCVDLEPDDRAWNPTDKKEWEGFEATCELLTLFRHRLEKRTRSPVNLSWFLKMDPQVATIYGSPAWSVHRYSAAIEALSAHGDSLGLHVHPWRWLEDSQRWIADFGNQEWVEQCVRMGVEAFRDSLGQPCKYFRFGDRWMNDATVDLLEALGVSVDLTIEMGQPPGAIPEIFTGMRPDYSSVPAHPYHPSREDFRRTGPGTTHALWCVPISGGSVRSRMLAMDRYRTGESWVLSRRGSAATGALLAEPNPIAVSFRGEAGATTVRWIAAGTGQVEVHVHAPDGPLFYSGGPSGSQRTGEWVTSGTVFFLQDASTEEPQSERSTLASLRVYTTIEEESRATVFPRTGERMTLDLAFNPLLFRRILDELLTTLPFPYLALVVRSDAPIREHLRFNLEQNLDFIASHPQLERFVFESPEALIRHFEASRLEREASPQSA